MGAAGGRLGFAAGPRIAICDCATLIIVFLYRPGHWRSWLRRCQVRYKFRSLGGAELQDGIDEEATEHDSPEGDDLSRSHLPSFPAYVSIQCARRRATQHQHSTSTAHTAHTAHTAQQPDPHKGTGRGGQQVTLARLPSGSSVTVNSKRKDSPRVPCERTISWWHWRLLFFSTAVCSTLAAGRWSKKGQSSRCNAELGSPDFIDVKIGATRHIGKSAGALWLASTLTVTVLDMATLVTI